MLLVNKLAVTFANWLIAHSIMILDADDWGTVAMAALAIGMSGLRLGSVGRKDQAWPLALARNVGHAMAGSALFGYALMTGSLAVLYGIGWLLHAQPALNSFKPHLVNTIVGSILGAFLGVYGWWVIGSRLEPRLLAWVQRHTQALTPDKMTDVRTVRSTLPATKAYDPRDYFARGSIFLGLDAKARAVRVNAVDLRDTHTLIMGATGAGKGVLAQVLALQCIRAGHSFVVIDPKGDNWAPKILMEECSRLSKPFWFVRLGIDEVPQLNPFQGTTRQCFTELIECGLGIEDRGSDADFYRARERAYVARLAEIHERVPGAALIQLVDELRRSAPAFDEEAAKLAHDLDSLANLACINAADEGALESALSGGGVVYVQGSVRNVAVVKLQKLLLLRFLQIVEQGNADQRHVTLFVDELKYTLSPTLLQALGTVRSKGANVIMAAQSLQDMSDCPGMSPDAVRGAILDNTGIKVFYAAHDPATAQWVCQRSGTIPVDVASRAVERNAELVELSDGARHSMAMNRPYIDLNTIYSLPKRCAVVFLPATPPTIIYTSPVKCEATSEPSVIPLTPATGSKTDRGAELI